MRKTKNKKKPTRKTADPSVPAAGHSNNESWAQRRTKDVEGLSGLMWALLGLFWRFVLFGISVLLVTVVAVAMFFTIRDKGIPQTEEIIGFFVEHWMKVVTISSAIVGGKMFVSRKARQAQNRNARRYANEPLPLTPDDVDPE